MDAAAADKALIERLRRERGASFCALFDDGNIDAYGGDDSAAEWALVNEFLSASGPDPERFERLMKLSALYRRPGRAEKWDTVHFSDGSTYIRGTIEKAGVARSNAGASSPGAGTDGAHDQFWQDSEPWPVLDEAAFYGP